MWTWEQERRRAAREPEAQLGQVTLSEETAVNLGGERRGLNVCAPGGYSWRPKEGLNVLVLKSESGDKPCVVGRVVEHTDLQPGQVRLTGGNCEILLGERLELMGEVYIGGQSLENYIRAIVAEELSGG